jgi:hypothetical protein
MVYKPRWIPITLTILCLTFVNQLVSNIISFRQVQYALKFSKQTNTTLKPLDDILYTGWFPVYAIPYVDQLGLLSSVDALTTIFAILVLFFWACRGAKLIPISELLVTEIFLLPMFALCQWFTVIPDSLPNCLIVNDIPLTDDMSWVWTRFGRACGDMLWSSDIAQIVIFTKLLEQTAKRGCCNCGKMTAKLLIRILGIAFIALVSAIALAARYQYSTDLLITIFTTTLVTTHGWTPRLGKTLFLYQGREEHDEEEGVAMIRHDD